MTLLLLIATIFSCMFYTHVLFHFHNNLRGRYYCPPFTDDETKAHRSCDILKVTANSNPGLTEVYISYQQYTN